MVNKVIQSGNLWPFTRPKLVIYAGHNYQTIFCNSRNYCY